MKFGLYQKVHVLLTILKIILKIKQKKILKVWINIISKGQWHQITNPFKEKCHIIEIQYGEACD